MQKTLWTKDMREALNQESVNDRAKLLMHRIAARQLASNPRLLTDARSRVSGSISGPDHVMEWKSLLDMGVLDVRRVLTSRSEKMDQLRLSSPFALLIDFKDPDLRRRIWKLARKGFMNGRIDQTVSTEPSL